MTEKKNNRTIGEMGIDARIILAKLLDLKVGERLSYDDLSSAIGRDMRPGNPGYSSFSSARVAAERDGVVIDVIQKWGIVRLDDIGIVKSGSRFVDSIHRLARRGRKRLSRVDKFDLLPSEAKIEHNVQMSQFGVLEEFSSTKTERRLHGRVKETGSYLPLAKTIEELK
jgi:hypothetical protein